MASETISGRRDFLGPRERKTGAAIILLVLALALLWAGASSPGASANADVVRAVYSAVAAVIVAVAVVEWASE